jgi:hypothetical protein
MSAPSAEGKALMETRVTTGTFVALACSVVLGYAAPQQKNPNTGGPPGAAPIGIGADRNSTTETISGCLQKGTTPRAFVLAPAGHTGTGAAAGTAAAAHGTRRELLTTSKTDLSKYVGRRVEITGTSVIGPAGEHRDDGGSRAADRPAFGGGTGERNRAAGDAGLTRFMVKTIKETAGSC